MKKILFILCAAAATLVACNKAEVAAPVANSSRIVRFETENLYSFETKAMSAGEFVGIWSAAPAEVGSNVKYTIAEGSPKKTLSATSPILWGVEQAGTSTTSDFFAVYPWKDAETFTHGSTGYVYNVDLTTGDTKTASIERAEQLMVAASKAAPGTGETPDPVDLSFKHPFAKIVYTITNNSDDAIRCATISGVYWNGSIDYSGEGPVYDVTATLSGSATDGTEANKTWLNGNSTDGFYTITYPKSDLAPAIKVFMYSGATYTFSLSSTLNAQAGKVYTASITLDHLQTQTSNGRSIAGTFTESDWSDPVAQTVASSNGYEEGEMESRPQLKGRNLKVGSNASGDFERDYPMALVGVNDLDEHIYRITVQKNAAVNTSMEFKVKVGNNWYGKDSQADETGSTGWVKVTGDGANNDPNMEWGYSDDADSYVTIYYNYTSHCMYVKSGEDVERTKNGDGKYVFF